MKIKYSLLFLLSITRVFSQEIPETIRPIPERSGGSYQLHQSSDQLIPDLGIVTDKLLFELTSTFLGFDFDDNGTETTSYFIPPDPIGAAGTDRLVAVVNVMIEARDKTGALLWRDALKDFFTTLSPTTYTFDPKVVWDHYENRFVVITLEQFQTGSNPNPGNISRILVAVSKTDSPASATTADWYYYAIDSKTIINSVDMWADYPGLELDEEAIYITNNMFEFSGGPNTEYGVRLWIIDKGVSSGFYAGGSASHTVHDPYSTGGGIATTTQPALVYGTGGAGSGVGTYLVSYSGFWDGIDEYVQVIRVNDPLGSVSFSQAWVNVGHIEDHSWGNLVDAPQSGTSTPIEVNDRRALDAVWRDDDNNGANIWFTTTIKPDAGYDAVNAGETTAHWFRINTSSWPPVLGDQGNIGGEDIAEGTYTFFPSLALNQTGDFYIGFSASAPSIYPGSYAVARHWFDSPGTVHSAETIFPGEDYYVRTFSGSRNRWGDYSGTALDPADDSVFWVFNEFALTRGLESGGDGRWGTGWGKLSISQPTITVTYPKTTTRWALGDTRSIRWKSTYLLPDDYVKIDLLLNDAFNSEIKASTKNDGLHSWTIPGGLTPSDQYSIRIQLVSNSAVNDKNDNPFTIVETLYPEVTVIKPNNDDNWIRGNTKNILWESVDLDKFEKVKIELYENSSFYSELVSQTRNDGKFEWDIPGGIPESDKYSVKITSLNYPTCVDTSDQPFSILDATTPYLQVSYPNNGEELARGMIPEIRWQRANLTKEDRVKIDLLLNGAFYEELKASTKNDGQANWAIPLDQLLSDQYTIRIRLALDSTVTDESEYPFSVVEAIDPTITVIKPNGGDEYIRGITKGIQWTSEGLLVTNKVKIDLLRNGTFYYEITPKTRNDGVFRWDIPDTLTLSDQYTIKVQNNDFPAAVDTSDATFSIIEAIAPSVEEFPSIQGLPLEYKIKQNYPNPFNPITTIRYQLPEESHVVLSIYDIMGRQVVQLINGTQAPGFKSVQWDSKDRFGNVVSAGMYLYHIQAGSYNKTIKMILLK
ncbi:T9SS type A sorting domain-containing protein [Candidatus Neomarinimicrobiota bacterium]